VAAWAWLASDRMIFLPPPPSYADGPGLLRLATADGERIAAVYLPNAGARYTLLVSHGNAEDLGGLMPFLPVLRDLGFAVLAYDYRGYGLSEGRPSERASYADIDAAYEYLTSRLGIPGERIIAYGRSVGSGPAMDLAARRALAGLVLESPFLTAFRVLTRVPLLPFDKFRNVDKIRQVRCPVLVMHGRADEVVPFWHGRKLFEAANEPKRLLAVEGAGHNDFVRAAGARYGQALREFEALVRRTQGL
jgi:fermentation-respiration switch protein FrsA (DUF1100 family)